MICPAEIVFWKNVPVTRHKLRRREQMKMDHFENKRLSPRTAKTIDFKIQATIEKS
jgi:hypothetical protein